MTINIKQVLIKNIKKNKDIMKHIELHDYTVITFARFLGLSGS